MKTGEEMAEGPPALGVLALEVEGSQSAKLGRLTAFAWRRVQGGAEQELELVAHFSESVVRVSVLVGTEHARRLGLAA